jgi:hypothetical protein
MGSIQQTILEMFILTSHTICIDITCDSIECGSVNHTQMKAPLIIAIISLISETINNGIKPVLIGEKSD